MISPFTPPALRHISFCSSDLSVKAKMVLDDEQDQPILDQTSTQTQAHLTTIPRWPTRRRMSLRRRKLPTARLGGKRRRKGFSLVRIFRKVRLKWLKLQYLCMVRKLQKYYRNMIKDFLEAGASLEAFHQKLVMETSFIAVPAMGISF